MNSLQRHLLASSPTVQGTSTELAPDGTIAERTGGKLRMPSNEFDHNPIHGVAFVPVEELCRYGFSEKFVELARQGFPGMGSYKGPKSSIGLGPSRDIAR